MDYSTDIWDYLTDMQNMPSRADRDQLVREAGADPVKFKRVRLWDYFFPVDVPSIGAPQKREIADLQRNLATAQTQFRQDEQSKQAEMDRLNGSLTQTKAESQRYLDSVEAAVRQKAARSRSRRLILGIIPIAIGLLLFMAFGSFAAGFNVGGSPVVCGGVLFIVFAALSLPFFLPLLGDREAKVKTLLEAETARQIPQFQAREKALVDQLGQTNEMSRVNRAKCDDFVKQSNARISYLRNAIDLLVNQTPPRPTAEEVEAWLLEDIAALRKVAIDKSGLRDRMGKEIVGTENPICIHSPAELQEPDRSPRIPSSFRQGGTNDNKHFWARQFGQKTNGQFVDFYAVYSIDYVLIADELFGTYSTTWDFIRGQQMGEYLGKGYYKKITFVVQQKENRQIQTKNGPVELYNSPLFTLRLENGEKYSVAFPDLEYMKAVNQKPFNDNDWGFDQSDAVDNAMKAINERISIAQKV